MKTRTEQIIDKSRLIAQILAEQHPGECEYMAARKALADRLRLHRWHHPRTLAKLFAFRGHYLAKLNLEQTARD